MTDPKLKSIVDRIENLEVERAAIGGDIRDVYSEAKSLNWSVKALRKVIAERKQKDQSDLDAEMERIRAALGSNSYRDAAKQLGISKSKLQRLVPKRESGTPHDPTTGEITQTAPDTPGEGASPRIIQNAGEGALAIHSNAGEGHGPGASPVLPDGIPASPLPTSPRPSCGPESGPDELAAQIPAGLIPQPASAPPQREVDSTGESCGAIRARPNVAPPGDAKSITPQPDSCSTDADRLRAQIPHSTDPERLEREAERAEGQAAYFCRECENTGRIVYDDGQKIHGSEECLACRRVEPESPTPPLGAAAEGDSPQRVARSEDDPWEAALASKARIDAMKAGRGVARQGEHRGCSVAEEGTQ